MSMPVTPMRVTPTTSVHIPESMSKLVARHIVADNILDDDDKTYIVSDSEEYEESDDSEDEDTKTGSKSKTEPDPDFIDGNLSQNDYSYFALGDKKSAPNHVAGSQKFQEFLLKHEIPRKMFHASTGLVTVYLYICGFSQHQIVVPLWAFFAAMSLFDVLRLYLTDVNEWILPWVKYFIRELEKHLCNGIVYFLAGVSLVLTFAAKDIAVVSILLLSWADTAASTFGRAFGKYTPQVAPGKSLSGSLASASVGVLVCYYFYAFLMPRNSVQKADDILWNATTSRINIHVYALFTGLIASVSEAIVITPVDDNFTLPVLSTVLLSALVYVCHI